MNFAQPSKKIGKLTGAITDILESNLILFSLHEKSFGFSNLLEEIYFQIQNYLNDLKTLF